MTEISDHRPSSSPPVPSNGPPLDECSDDDLIDTLVERGVIDEWDAEAIRGYAAVAQACDFDIDAYHEAVHRIIRGDHVEALIWIERALGEPFIGRLAP